MAIVYLLTNRLNGKRYVGKTRETLQFRWNHHRYKARNGSPYALHAAIRKHGHEAFDREVLAEFATEEEALAAEKDWIAKLGTMTPEHGYNMVEGGRGALGFRHTEEERARRSERVKGFWNDPEYRAKCTASGAATLTSPEVRAKIAATKGTEEWRAAQSARTREFQARPEVKAKMIAAVTERFSDPEFKAKNEAILAEARRQWTDATHCSKGHEFTEANTYRPPGSKNVRICRQCTNDYARSRRTPKPKRTHCKRGHERTPENMMPGKLRLCIPCEMERRAQKGPERKALYRAARDAGLSVSEARDVRDGKMTLPANLPACPETSSLAE